MNRIPVIAVIGDASLLPEDVRSWQAERLGGLIMDQGWSLVTGGMGGVMEAASRGARNSAAWQPGRILGILPGFDPGAANPYVDIPLATGLDHARNVLVAQADAVVAIGGRAGTLSEMAFAWLHYRLLIAFEGEGWAGRLAGHRIDDRERYPDIPEDCVYGVTSPEEAIARLHQYLPRYHRRHSGIGASKHR